MSEVLRATHLSQRYRISSGFFKAPAYVHALSDISLSLNAGQTLAIVGESGCGKSTLARALSLIETPIEGQLEIAGINALQASKTQRKALRQRVQMVFQNPYASLNPRQKIADQLAEPLLLNTPLKRTERREQVLNMLEQVGLRPEHAARYPHMFSGGQRQRIAIARAMMLKPSVLIADEPTSALDVSIQAQILNLLMDLQAQYATAYVFISHNLSVVRHIADQVMVMYLGRAVEIGSAEAIYQKPLHPYSRALLAATPRLDAKAAITRLSGEPPNPLAPPNGCAFHSRCPYADQRCRHERPELRLIDAREVACHHLERIA